MLKVREHAELLSAQYLARCLEPENVCHSVSTRETPKRLMKETIFTRYCNTVEPMMVADNRKATLQETHTDATRLSTFRKEYSVRCCCLPTPMTLARVRCSRLWSTSPFSVHLASSAVTNPGRQCGAYVGAVEDIMCVDVTEGV